MANSNDSEPGKSRKAYLSPDQDRLAEFLRENEASIRANGVRVIMPSRERINEILREHGLPAPGLDPQAGPPPFPLEGPPEREPAARPEAGSEAASEPEANQGVARQPLVRRYTRLPEVFRDLANDQEP